MSLLLTFTHYSVVTIVYSEQVNTGRKLTLLSLEGSWKFEVCQKVNTLQIHLWFISDDGTRPSLPPVPATIPLTTAPAGCRDTPGNPCEHWKKVGWCKSYDSIKKLCCKSCSGEKKALYSTK